MRHRPHLLHAIVSITRRNMVHLYNATSTSTWRWSNQKKKKELSDHNTRFIVVRSSELVECNARNGEAEASGEESESSSVRHPADAPTSSSARDDGKDVVGYIAFRLTTERAIEVLYVDELQIVGAARGRGLGKYLMHLVEAIAEECSMKLLMLTVLTKNESAQSFYSKCGLAVD